MYEKIVFIQVQVKSAFVLAMRAVEKCSGNVRSSFFLRIIFIFTVRLSECEAVHLNIDFVQFLYFIKLVQLRPMKLFLRKAGFLVLVIIVLSVPF